MRLENLVDETLLARGVLRTSTLQQGEFERQETGIESRVDVGSRI